MGLLDRSMDALETVTSAIETETVTLTCDGRERKAVDRTVTQLLDTFGGLDVVVNNAGVIGHAKLVNASDDDGSARMPRSVCVTSFLYGITANNRRVGLVPNIFWAKISTGYCSTSRRLKERSGRDQLHYTTILVISPPEE